MNPDRGIRSAREGRCVQIGGSLSSRAVLTCLALSAAVIAGCGGTGKSKDSDKNPPFRARVEITKEGYRPRHVKILVGGSVTFVNLDKSSDHTAETGDLPDGASDNNEFDTHTLTWEEPYTVTFHKPEVVEYYSSFDSEMRGTVEAVIKR